MDKMQDLGVGVDIENIDRFRNMDLKGDKTFLNKIFTKKEQNYCFSKKEPGKHLAARYAGKEAVVKALYSLGKNNLDYKLIEIFNNKNNAPRVNIHHRGSKTLKVYISLSHCADKAIAFAIATKNEKY